MTMTPWNFVHGQGSKDLTMAMTPWNLTHGQWSKDLTITMTPWNLTHGQWSKDLTMATDILESAPWSMVKMVIFWFNFVVRSTVYHSDHINFVFRSWPWSKFVFFG